ncbi:hypothetical protein NDU88_001960 [Pleurodeles waltl]|uniref:Uncharacterized protein n=1 Tax=Pleurodeles waltl TaxID=8319 RepID=A0AAV7VCG4_PLEWA|nr:hypothetical protein NDU88_001960 [Pleurodeles waltl]
MPWGRCVELRNWQDEVTGAASILWALHENFYRTAVAASIPLRKLGYVFPAQLCVDPVGCASNFLPLRWLSIDLLLAKSDHLVPVRRAVIFSPQGMLCVVSGRRCINSRSTGSSFCRNEVFLVLRLQGTGGKLYPSPCRALLSTVREQQVSRTTARQQSFSESSQVSPLDSQAVLPGRLQVLVQVLLQEVSELVAAEALFKYPNVPLKCGSLQRVA